MVEEITIQELAQMEPSACQIIDMRDETAFALGHIDGAVLIPQKELETSHGELPRDKMLVIYCRSGILSADVAEQLRDEGYQAVNLVGGYVQWLQDKIRRETKNEKAAEVEQGLRKKFHRVIFSRFAKAIKTYDLIQPNDRIAVCISGGKDSMLMAKLFQELQRHGKFPFELVFLVMDPGYSAENRQIIESNAKLLQIPITVFETNIFDSVYNVQNNPCYLCARMRRGHLYNKAKELGCNKIALGHHFDDEHDLRRTGGDHDAETAQRQLRGNAADTSHVSDPGGGHQALVPLSRLAVYPVRLPFHRHLHHLRPGRADGFQAHGDKTADCQAGGGESADRKEYFPQRGKYQLEQNHFLPERSCDTQLFGWVCQRVNLFIESRYFVDLPASFC